ncbi:uncharacterized protein N7479_006373 [Penicillium vulpinum]|uniref:uncharacterized protein n=1 Tax=Penicillium vulpinum TaxID=29845 RepID=UPI0025497C71|nr:uncharacterized protein N7479_006373 [Penicillium vulpinum]KAJ5959223.1 hypothetical protein N7479_006373 [Penicillium vulpinum]
MSSCNFNCSAPTPALSPNSDITGIGIITNNIVTAGLAIVIISLHYVTVYDETRDPFQKAGQSFRPNPIDESSLKLPKLIIRPLFENGKKGKFSNFLIKCTRAMSDIQILTGCSILISGFSQLKCGLATYYWLVIIHLAWISCLTQLSCLTVLRNYLYDHSIERALRLLVVGILVILLIVGLSFTGNYQWAFDADNGDHPTLSDPAVCYMRSRLEMSSAFLSMPLSMILIIFGFGSRVIGLYDTLLSGVVRVRTLLAAPIRRLLRIVYNWSHASGSPQSLKLTLCYLPLLSIYLTWLVLVDVWDSVIIEVAWLITAFAFGISRLIGTIYRPESMGLEASLTGFNDWSFGQVTAMVLLVAPLITILEYFQDESTKRSNTRAQDKQDEPRIQDESRAEDEEQPLSDDQPIPPPELPAISSLAAMDSNDPDNDWIFHPNISDLIMTHLSTLISGVIIWTAHRDPLGKMNETLLDGYLMFAGIGMVVLILCSLMVETIFTESGPSLQLAVRLYSIAFLACPVPIYAKITYCLLALLVIVALAHRFWV